MPVRITPQQADALFALLDSQQDTNKRVWVRLDAIVEELTKLSERLDEVERLAYELSNRD
jgi:hypothetical protein